MPRFSRRSLHRLRTCRTSLQDVFNVVIEWFDCTILEGHRGEEAQNRAYADGKSKVQWPDGNHNAYPSKAVDAGPYDPEVRGVNWDTEIAEPKYGLVRWKAVWNLCRFYYFAGFVMGTAASMGVRLRWGGDWDGDTKLDDQSFRDLVHFEEREQEEPQ